jgi:hypothetical protein
MQVRYLIRSKILLILAVLKNLALDLFLTLQNFEMAYYFSFSNGRGTLRVNFLRFNFLAVLDDFDSRSVIFLLHAINASDEKIWLQFYDLAIESTPPPRQLSYPH